MSVPNIRWSNSSLTTLQSCGEKFRRQYIEREWVPAGPRGIRGWAVHRVATTAFLRKLAGDALPSVEEAKDLAATEFDRAWRSGVTLSEEDSATGIAAVEAHAKDFAVDLSGYHIEAVAPAINPIGVERKITVKPKDSDITILGVIDLIDGQPDGEIIRDLKTAEKSPSAGTAETSQQLSLYAMIRLAEVGKLPASLALDFLVRTPVRAEKKHVVLTTTRTEEDVRVMVNRINVAVETVKRGVFMPAPADAWYCSRAYCPYFDTCAYTAHGRRRPKD